MDVSETDWHKGFLGEFRRSPSFHEYENEACFELTDPLDVNDTQRRRFEGITTTVAPTVMRYVHDGNGFDCSSSHSVSGYTPSIWLARRMGLHWNRRRFAFSDPSGRVVAFDPSHEEAGVDAFLIRPDPLVAFLKKNDLSLIWFLIGEKMLTGDPILEPSDRTKPRITVFRNIFRLTDSGVELVIRNAGHLGDSPVHY